MKYIYSIFITFLFYSTSFCQTGQLIIWKNNAKPILSLTDMDAFEKIAKENELKLIYKDINDGSPKEITYTPAIVFQNENGRSFYYGRYKNISRIKNFIRTSSLAHQQPTKNFKNDLIVWKEGKTVVTAPLKLTELKGEKPKKYNEVEFVENATSNIVNGMSKFKLESSINLSRTYRAFYFNLYPYVDEKCNLTIGAEIFSQFNCIDPVLQVDEKGLVSGKWKNRNQLFKEAGKIIEEHIFRIMKESVVGDAMQTIDGSISEKSWQQLNVNLPKRIISKNEVATQLDVIPEKWVVESREDNNSPFCIFSFLAPVDSYAGEAKSMSGSFTLQEENKLSSATGHFEIRIEDITMGAEDFDREVQNKMLKKADFPISHYDIEDLKLESQEFKLGQPIPFESTGFFYLMGKSLQLKVAGQFIPLLNEKEELRMQVNCAFNLPLFEQFRVEGPDGPSPAKDTLQFFMKFNLKPILK